MLLPIVVDEYDPIVQKVKWLISHNEDGSRNEEYTFKDVGEGLHLADGDVIKRFREDHGLTITPVIDRELLRYLDVAEYDETYEDQCEPFVIGNKWQLALSIGFVILVFILLMI